MSPQEIQLLFDYNTWANHRSLGAAEKLTQEQFTQPLGSSFSSVRVMEYKTLRFGIYNNPLWQSMQHVVNHGTYHRGQVTTLLRQLGAEPVLTDLMHFYRERSVATGA